MDDKLRKYIKDNTETLIDLTDYKNLMDACVQRGILTPEMRRNLEDISPSLHTDKDVLQHELHKRLFFKLTKRGPTAYQRLVQILVDLNCTKAVNVLNEHRNENSFQSLAHNRNNMKRQRPPPMTRQEATEIVEEQEQVDHEQPQIINRDDDEPALQLYTKDIKPKEISVKKSRSIRNDPILGTYSMKSQNNRGVFFMVNIIDFNDPAKRRNGAKSDADSMLYLFKELGFKLFYYENLTLIQFQHLLDAVIKSEYTRDTECFVLALMSHGSCEGSTEFVEFSDSAHVKVQSIEDQFSNDICPHLNEKPKILLFPFCRGDRPDTGTIAKTNVETDGHSTNIMRKPTKSDMLICYASSRGFESHRDPENGSWYIQKFCEVMSEYACNTDFLDIIRKVQANTGKLRTGLGAMQTGNFINIGFNQKLFFNPGCWEEE